MTTDESNKIFAKFMGFQPDGKFLTKWNSGYNDCKVYSPEELLFHSSWDWLMPVVEKLRSLGIEFTIELRKQGWRIVFFKPDQNLLIDVWGKFGPEIVYTGALQAIQWYNEQTKS